MNPQAHPNIRPDLDVALFDFAAAHAQDPAQALYQLQMLLLDEDTCLARVAFLRSLAAAAGRTASRGDFRADVALICEEGLLPAFAAGRLTPDRVARLDALTRDPDALLQARRRLLDEEDQGPAPPPRPTKDDTAVRHGETSFTMLFRTGRIADLEKRLRPWLPFLLRRVRLADDLDEALAGRFLDYVRRHLPEVRQRSFRELLPGWLADFARQEQRADRLRVVLPQPEQLEADAVESVLRRAGENESPLAKQFREQALAAGVQTAQALLSFEGPGAEKFPALPNYRRDLFREARQARHDVLELLECNPE